ncbi:MULTISPECIES: NAD(P)H-dependent flavin oxidoreductase [unclassified Clostridium]|jgi:oxidoreductase|uniref:NAD(P)H-dependent flavin oxidoreductase n=1 Tax=unclassified Clostridium TaxID=2614128 RepID=UPI0025BA5AAE|nr:nitronate monooxygenase family protein [Clostridium sp.]MCI6692381.1 nitronate monooxygenase family protein [Clostridium sp.]MDY2631317.1 nitronate monooxygenase family protein [Clostridium sp.]MDY4252459.1 nitronate monooxygenase family protein [Clostridium sp.]
MNINPLKIGDLVAKIPIIQGGMGVGVSLSNLAGNVAKHGAIGVISAAHPGYLEEDFETNTLSANIRGLTKHIKKAKEISSNGIIGVNVMVAMNNYIEHVKTAIEAGADLIISGAGLPLNLPDITKGSSIKIAPIVSSSKAARIILTYWKKHFNKTADAVIVEGPLAGGHLGFKKDKIDEETNSFDKNVQSVIEEVKNFENEFNKTIPVVVAGGVFTHQDMIKYLNIGASGVQVATPFVATYECDAHINFKNAFVNCKKEDIELTISPVGMPGRAIKNKLTETLKTQKVKITKCYNCLIPCNPTSTPYCISSALIKAVKGDVENGLVFCGANAYRINKLSSVKEILNKLMKAT